MKKQILLLAMFMTAFIGASKEQKTLRVTTEPVMVCHNCENKIKKNLRFEKGISNITTDINRQVVTIIYDADKTNPDKILKAFGKIQYKAVVLPEDTEKADTNIRHDDNCSDE